tara:strand:- start:1080 stop:1541 length:462 start_codon:yes stop_codon:yes gene_type:complete
MKEKDIEKKIKELEKEKQVFLEGWQRAKADLANYKQEEKKRMQGLLEYAKGEFLVSFLSMIDNLDRAEKELTGKEKESKLVQGFLQIGQQLRKFLNNEGINEIEAEGKDFDPALHEAIGMVEKGKSGKVAEVVEKGYTLNDQLLRPAKVNVVK